jgi:hypothetical protein
VAWRFFRNILFALCIFLIIGLLCQLNLSVTQPIEEYLAFVVTTDFSIAPVVKKIASIETLLGNWDLSSLMQGLPRISTGW